MKIVNVLASEAWGEINPAALEQGLGGRESAMIRLSREWAKLGHEVTSFVPIERGERHWEDINHSNGGYDPEDAGFHEYVPIQLAKPMLASFPYDAVVAWECPAVFSDERIVDKQKVRLTEMQVAHFHAGQMEAAEQHSTGVVALSGWHREFLQHSGLEMKDDQLYVLPNGVDIANYPLRKDFGKLPDTKRFVYSSSPDRGLWHLLKLWPRIRALWKDAELFVAYGVSKYTDPVRWSHNRQGEQAVELEQLMKQDGVFDIGKTGQKQLAALQSKCSAWLYPCDTIQPTETGCITAVEAGAAGTPIITTDCDCMEEEFKGVGVVVPLPFNDGDDFLHATQDVLENPTAYNDLAIVGRDMAEERDWSMIAPDWIALFEEQLAAA